MRRLPAETRFDAHHPAASCPAERGDDPLGWSHRGWRARVSRDDAARSGVLNWPLAVEREVRQQQAVGREWQQLQRREPLDRLLGASDALRLRSCGALR